MRTAARTTLAGLALAAAAGLTGCGTSASPGPLPTTPTPAAATPHASAAPSVTTLPPTAPTRVRFTVTGTGEPQISYGSSSDNRDGGGTLGELGEGNAVPWHASMRYDDGAEYYFLSAQLGTGGRISCKITATGPGDQPLVVARGHASGQYEVCDAQAASFDGGLSWQREG